MRSLAAATLSPRIRKSLGLSVALTFVIIVGLLYSRGTLDNHIDQSLNLISGTVTPLPKLKAAELPDFSQWLATPSAWTIDWKNDSKFNVKESFEVRQEVGRKLNTLFTGYEPPFSHINESFFKRWPTMPPYQVGKKFDPDEVVHASQNFLLKDEFYSDFRTQQQSLMKSIPTWAEVSKGYSGRGIVISAGSIHLNRVWPNTVLMLRSLGCTLPIEIWTKDQSEYDITLPIAHQIRTEFGIPISVHAVNNYISVAWDDYDIPSFFKVKALALLFSSFEEIILLDADNIPAMNPETLFDSEAGKSGLIQWPDFWSNSVSKTLHDAYDIDYSMAQTCESGQMLINKKKHFEPLVMATYYNWWGPRFFYKLIYLDSMGAGDKDTFWLGSAAYHREYHVVQRKLESIKLRKKDGSLWKQQNDIFNGALGQFNPSNSSEIFFMHMHSPKINMQADELAGQYDVQFFKPDKSQNAHFAMGEDWLEARLWENIQWVECESILREPTTDACAGVKARVESMKNPAEPYN